MKTTLNRIAKIGMLVGLVAIVTGCCVAPFGYGHGHYRSGYSQGPYGH